MASSSSDKKKVFVLEDVSGGKICPPDSFIVAENEHLDITFIVLPGLSANLPVTIDLTGPGAEVSLKGIYLSSGTDEVSFNITINHLVGHCVSNQLFNGIASGAAKCAFFGKIIVAPDAQKTEAYQENHNIVLSDDASVNTSRSLKSMRTVLHAVTRDPRRRG